MNETLASTVSGIIHAGTTARFTGTVLPVRDPGSWDALREGRLREMSAAAASSGVMFTDDNALAVASASLGTDGIWDLAPALTTYHRWAASSGSLDRALTDSEQQSVPGTGSTLRERWNAVFDSPADIAGLPAPAKAGCGVVPVTRDGFLVMGVRRRAFVAAGHPGEYRENVHVVAEGMLPQDTGADGVIEASAAAARGLAEELDVHEAQIIPTGFFLDAQRWQPVFSFLAYLPLSYNQVWDSAAGADDSWESDRLMALPFADGPELRALVEGTHPELLMASNHAQAYLACAMDHAFGAGN
ncbi:hypothetical protein [Arthrobacter sp. IK3]|uniref:hypothetical protein n=1 Tax=Arthrobacter sp. IK3 TaxID=3448169 RepID=UPI003EE0EB2A